MKSLSRILMVQWLYDNLGKTFAIATPDGLFKYTAEFIPNTGEIHGIPCGDIIIDDPTTPKPTPDKLAEPANREE